MTAYDYVVVGAGVAGSLVAARLSRRPGTTVLLLEAGTRLPEGPPARDPARAAELYGTDADWADETVPQPGLGGRTVRWPAGRALGGSSAINAALWVRGNPADYDEWAAYGGAGWDHRAALAAFRRLEYAARVVDSYPAFADLPDRLGAKFPEAGGARPLAAHR
nr:GMC family oxidoreductase N-terminal domain-containing protein [Streptomyces sp. NBC_00899]